MNRLLLDLTLSLLQAYRTFIDITIQHVETYKTQILYDEENPQTIYTPSTERTLSQEPAARCHWCSNPVRDQRTRHCEFHLTTTERDERNIPRNHQRFSR